MGVLPDLLHLNPGDELGDYRIVEPIGVGGMGQVYLAKDVRDGAMYALKTLPEAAATDPEFVKRFQDEARVMAQLDHPHIVKVHAIGTDEGRYYFVMDYVEGPPASGEEEQRKGSLNLSEYLKEQPGERLPEDLAEKWSRQVIRALSYAHKQGVVHRDIKPANLLIDPEGNVKLTDFGLAKVVGNEFLLDRAQHTMESLSGDDMLLFEQTATFEASIAMPGHSTESFSIMGTYDYMAPEQRLAQGEVDGRTDVYAFGLLLYRVLTGRLPPRGRAKSIAELVPGLTKDWDTVAFRCIEDDPQDRFQSADELLAALGKGRRRTRLFATVVGAVVVVGLGAAFVLLRDRESDRPEGMRERNSGAGTSGGTTVDPRAHEKSAKEARTGFRNKRKELESLGDLKRFTPIVAWAGGDEKADLDALPSACGALARLLADATRRAEIAYRAEHYEDADRLFREAWTQAEEFLKTAVRGEDAEFRRTLKAVEKLIREYEEVDAWAREGDYGRIDPSLAPLGLREAVGLARAAGAECNGQRYAIALRGFCQAVDKLNVFKEKAAALSGEARLDHAVKRLTELDPPGDSTYTRISELFQDDAEIDLDDIQGSHWFRKAFDAAAKARKELRAELFQEASSSFDDACEELDAAVNGLAVAEETNYEEVRDRLAPEDLSGEDKKAYETATTLAGNAAGSGEPHQAVRLWREAIATLSPLLKSPETSGNGSEPDASKARKAYYDFRGKLLKHLEEDDLRAAEESARTADRLSGDGAWDDAEKEYREARKALVRVATERLRESFEKALDSLEGEGRHRRARLKHYLTWIGRAGDYDRIVKPVDPKGDKLEANEVLSRLGKMREFEDLVRQCLEHDKDRRDHWGLPFEYSVPDEKNRVVGPPEKEGGWFIYEIREPPGGTPTKMVLITLGEPPFLIDRCEVTNKRALTWKGLTDAMKTAEKNAGKNADFWSWTEKGRDDALQPLICPFLSLAEDFARWAQKQLPTPTQWDLAARADPKGTWRSAETRLSYFGHRETLSYAPKVTQLGKDISPLGVIGMATGVSEWCSDKRVWGGSFQDGPRTKAFKRKRATHGNFIGLRCVIELELKQE